MRADDDLPVDGEVGEFTQSDSVLIDCSVAGLFFNSSGSGPPFIPPAPAITGVGDNTTGLNTINQGTSGYLAIYGTALTAWGETPTPVVSGDSGVTLSTYWASDTQVNASYTVAAQATVGQHTLTLQTEAGKAQGTYVVAAKIVLVVSGNSFIFVGSDPQEPYANSFFAGNGSGGYPQPSGGTLSATSSDPSDVATVVSGPPAVRFTTSDQSKIDLDRTLTFKYTAGGQSASQSMKVTARQFAYATNNAPSDVCTLGYGTSPTYVYTVYTHPDGQAVDSGSGLSGTAATESFNPGLTCGQHTGGGALDANGQFSDSLIYCSSSPLTCSSTNTQTLSVAGFSVRTNTLTYSGSGIAYTSKGPTQ